MSHHCRTDQDSHGIGRAPGRSPSERWDNEYAAAVSRPAGRIGAEAFDTLPRASRTEAGLARTPPVRYRSILVPLDGTPFAEHALPLALQIARRAGSVLRVAHVHSLRDLVYPTDWLFFDGRLDVEWERRPQAYLEEVARRLRAISSVLGPPSLLEGREVVGPLGEAAARTGADLVVMATHGRGPLARFWNGSVADELVRRLAIPLLLVRGQETPPDLGQAPAVRHVLIPLDGSPRAEQILKPALALGSLMGADHTLLRVFPAEYAAAQDYLPGVAERLGGRAQRVHGRLLGTDLAPAEAILQHARDHEADLIALTTRGRGELARLFRGSVTDRVIQGAQVPVLVVRADEE